MKLTDLLSEGLQFTNWYDWKDQVKKLGYTTGRHADDIVAKDDKGNIVGIWAKGRKFLHGGKPRPEYKAPKDNPGKLEKKFA